VIGTSRRVELAQISLIVALFLWSVLLWPFAPDRIPTHFDLGGNVDMTGSKLEGLFAMPMVALVLYVLLRFLPRLDPARANYASFASAYGTIRVTVLTMVAVIDLAVLSPVAGVMVDQAVAMRLILGGVLLVFGTLMGKIRPNWLVGIRTPWTLRSKEAWVRTHRLAGWIFLFVGCVFLVSTLLPSALGSVISFGCLALGLGWIVAFSYRVWKHDPIRYPATSTRPVPE
jgi:uncharacterized membrane protein